VAHEQLPILPSTVEAASVIKPIVACKDEADSRKVLDFLGKNDKAGLDKFSGIMAQLPQEV
jgi:hypothetical protein